MKMILLPYRASMLIIGFAMLVAGLNIRSNKQPSEQRKSIQYMESFKSEKASSQKLVVVQYDTNRQQHDTTRQQHDTKHSGMAEKLTKCGVSAETIENMMACTKAKADEYIKLSFQIFQKPDHAKQTWNLLEALKTCTTKYTEIKKCLMPRSDDRPEKHEKRWLNPFHFETITESLIRYITAKPESMFKKCVVDPQKIPVISLCLKKIHDENKDVQSKDPKKALIAMSRFMFSSLNCFANITQSQGLCINNDLQEMRKTINRHALIMGQIMDQILQECNATSEIVSCSNVKKNRLVQLAKTVVTKDVNVETIWNVGDSLKTCLTNHTTIESCVLNKHKTWPKEGESSRQARSRPKVG